MFGAKQGGCFSTIEITIQKFSLYLDCISKNVGYFELFTRSFSYLESFFCIFIYHAESRYILKNSTSNLWERCLFIRIYVVQKITIVTLTSILGMIELEDNNNSFVIGILAVNLNYSIVISVVIPLEY